MATSETTIAAAPVIGRLAPSPTGTLHLGNARSFLLAWLSVRQQAGTLILRIEDIDTPRVKAGSVESTLDDLRWLGLDWDFGPDFNHGLYRGIPVTQSQRLSRYHEVLRTLIRAGRIYRCSCTRSQIAQASASAPHESSLQQLEGPIYPGTCRSASANYPSDDMQFDSADATALRWAFESESIRWWDGALGSQEANPAKQVGDFVIARANGMPSYQLAVVVDDHDMGITEIVRGDDLVVSTYRQLAILRQLMWTQPSYFHVPLVLDNEGRRMAKRQGDSLKHFRDEDIASQKVIGYLAHSLGLIDRSEPISPRELVGQLDWSKLPRGPTQFMGSFD